MLAGEPYEPGDQELTADRERCADLTRRFNAEPDESTRDELLRELLGSVGEDAYVRPPFYCDYGYNLALGPRTFLNFNCVVLDVAPVRIGARVQIASAVQILTADHPIDPEERASGIESARPITVEDDVWLGGGVILCPGVTVGEGSVIGAGSVVIRDIPPRVVAVGNPCRVVKPIA